MSQHYDIIIAGGGPAGLTAAIYARRAGRSVLLLEKESFGGQIATAPKVENFPGFSAISGAELADRMYTQAETLGASIELEEVLSIQPGPVITVTTDYGVHTCTALILATGMKRRTLGLPGEERLSGVSYCAVCDGAFYAGRDVAVVGGGSAALQDALFLADTCRNRHRHSPPGPVPGGPGAGRCPAGPGQRRVGDGHRGHRPAGKQRDPRRGTPAKHRYRRDPGTGSSRSF